MKYIKAFETLTSGEKEYYSVGSYFLVLGKPTKGIDGANFCKAEIIDITPHVSHMIVCLVLDEQKNIFYEETYTPAFLERKLTPEEIKEFEFQKIVNNYNIEKTSSQRFFHFKPLSIFII
jgi:hypothetical protein